MTLTLTPTESHVDGLESLLDVVQTREMLESVAAMARVDLALLNAGGTAIIETSWSGRERRRRIESDVGIPVVDPQTGERLGSVMVHSKRGLRPEAMQLVESFAAGVGRAASHERVAQQRAAELTTIYNTSMMLAEARDLNAVLNRTVQLVAEVMDVKGAGIRLIDPERDELRFVAVHGLSDSYLKSAPLRLSAAAIDQAAMRNGHEQVPDLRSDPRVHFPDILKAEGIVSILSVPLRYRQQNIGVLRAYAGERRRFTTGEVDLMRAVASQSAAAIANARLAEESAQADALEQQVLLAADVQQRMVPPQPAACNGLELASIYVPCYELAGDLFDFIPLERNRIGVVIADVAGKGVPASLIMATVRAYLRAGSEGFDSLPEMIARLNAMLCNDNRPGEFVSLFYGIFDGPARHLDYVLAGHTPPLLLRDGVVAALGPPGDTVLGVVPEATFSSRRAELKEHDRLLLYTDGLDEARNFQNDFFGAPRVAQSFAQPAETAQAIVQNVVWDMRRFVGMQQRSDDVTVIAVRVIA